ncbi:hypothetical protein GCM10023115_01960 [Pontixanthobacter gangjinensis]|uniref:Acid phosphatase n=1 Tax=Pontixanthobacter gangjinensis TaxID=1028742 RepID=A0A6I4SJZ6_9SPHN|nr:hypothetical protein [Pontixanthobacter gangjinensis]MXO55450.1 hypothetical protein [Pontixanthobacter gangjinensis]
MKPASLRLAASLALLPLLGGCVAALIPVAAGGAMFGKDKIGLGDSSDDPVQADPTVIVEAAIAAKGLAEATSEETVADPLPAAELLAENPTIAGAFAESAPNAVAVKSQPSKTTELPARLPKTTGYKEPSVAGAPTAEPRFEEAFAPVQAVSMPIVATTTTTSTPPITAGVTQSAPTYGPTDFRAYDALYSYVDSQARRDPVQSSRQSALLAAPGTLSPIRTDCSIRPPAVLIDLDPENAVFDPGVEAQPNPALSQLLASLRAQEIEVFWISELSAIQAGAVRKALVASSMDPVGRDGLLLMRRIEDRKQARRKELAETHCLLAIAGDTRADFDELYLYLKDANTAQPLESLIGAGWFITPLPLITPNQNPEG